VLSVLVLGIGNLLLMDEGTGVRAVHELERKYRYPKAVEVLDGGTSGIELLGYIRNKDHLILIDAVKSGHPPGTVVRVEGEDVPATFLTRISPHQLGISDVLAAAKLTGELPAQMVLFGIEPKIMDTGLSLSKEVEDNLGKLVEAVVEELRNLGYNLQPRTESEARGAGFWEKQWTRGRMTEDR
jgi:hydrogenase maturation protease